MGPNINTIDQQNKEDIYIADSYSGEDNDLPKINEPPRLNHN